MSDFDYCDAPGCSVYGSMVNGLCAEHRASRVIDIDDDGFRIRIVDTDLDWKCDNCPAVIDAPGLCGRCMRALNEELEEMRRR